MRYLQVVVLLMFSLPTQAVQACQDVTFEGWKELVREAPLVFVGVVTTIVPRVGREGGWDVTIRVDQPIRGSIAGDYYSAERYDDDMCQIPYAAGDQVIYVGGVLAHYFGPVAVVLAGRLTSYEQERLGFALSLRR